jgi:alkanesulfonate monooxygenase SsuD/methylene tetrahydromethanopterin reductase-like flavin-dependent oxidoreductase (luciferase family)
LQIGIDSFAAAYDEASLAISPSGRLGNLVEQIEHADQVGLDVFGIGEHHRREYLDSAPAVILGAAAARTHRIRLTSAVTVLSSADPVRVFQNFATLRAALTGQGVYPRPVAATTREAADDFYPGYARAVTEVGRERGWPAATRASFDGQRGPQGALLIGAPDEVGEKILRHSEALGGISRISLQMNAASLPHAKLMQAIEAIGTRVAPALRERVADDKRNPGSHVTENSVG